ncbi:hypothetical protein HK405_010814 [Cladochytrium tenue]|nr:hypothetical protein HK405_010814 [Cladochytrium tenue]
MAGDMESAAAEWTVHHKNDAVLGVLVAGIIEKDPKERQRLLEKAGLNLGLAAVNVVAAASLAINPMVGAAALATHHTAVGAAAGFTGLIGCLTGAAIIAAFPRPRHIPLGALRTANTAAPAKATAATTKSTALATESAAEATKFDAGATEPAAIAAGPAAPDHSIGLAGELAAHVQSICSTIATNFAKEPVTKTPVTRTAVTRAQWSPFVAMGARTRQRHRHPHLFAPGEMFVTVKKTTSAEVTDSFVFRIAFLALKLCPASYKDRIAFGLCLLMVIVSNYVLLRLFEQYHLNRAVPTAVGSRCLTAQQGVVQL